MKSVVKKSMLIAGIMACLFSSSVFAERAVITPEKDRATQEQGLRKNQKFDQKHGYSKDGQEASVKKDKAEKKKVKEETKWEKAVEKDRKTQEKALEKNRKYDEAHGYK